MMMMMRYTHEFNLQVVIGKSKFIFYMHSAKNIC